MHVGSRGRCPFYRLSQMLETGWGSEWAERPDWIIVTAQLTSPRLLFMLLSGPWTNFAFRYGIANSQHLRWYQGCCCRAWKESRQQGCLAAHRHTNNTEQKRNYWWPAVGQLARIYELQLAMFSFSFDNHIIFLLNQLKNCKKKKI